MTDLYEAGDINQTDGGGNDDFDDELDDEFDDELEDDEIEGDDDGNVGSLVAEAGNEVDDDSDDDSGHGAGIGNEAGGDGTPHAVLTYLAKSLANEPDAVNIETEDRRGGVRLNLHVAPEDMGRVIGRRGRTAQAIRTLVNVAGAKDGVQASVDIVDD